MVRGDGGSAWVVVVPGTQPWSPRAGGNPFDLTSDVLDVLAEHGVAAVTLFEHERQVYGPMSLSA